MDINYDTRREEQKSSHSSHPSVRFRNRFLLKSLERINFKTVMDIGCGDGYLLALLNKNYPNRKYSGIDISEFIIEENKKKYKNIDFFQGDIGNQKFFHENTYDVVICSEVIEHIKDWKTVIKNLGKITNKGGYLLLTTQSGHRYKSDINIGHLKHFELYELEDEGKRNGYNVVFSIKRGFPFYNMQKRLYEKIENKAKKIQTTKTTLFSKILFGYTYLLFLISIKSRQFGPQIFIILQKDNI